MKDIQFPLTWEQFEVLREWLTGRRADIEDGWEDLGELRPLLTLLDEPGVTAEGATDERSG